MMFAIKREVRATRQQHAARFNFNLQKIAEDLKKRKDNQDVSLFRFPANLLYRKK